jgi:DNA-binding NtrC family response regulator
VILLTAWGSISLAVRGIRAGAFDFVTKSWNNLALLQTIRTDIQLNREAISTGETPSGPVASKKIVGKSPLLLRVLETVAIIAPTDATVLITGESGTGKELIA